MYRNSQGDRDNKTSAVTNSTDLKRPICVISTTIALTVTIVDDLLVVKSDRNENFGAVNVTTTRSCLKNLIFLVV
jgi:hypothetical protein